MVAPAAMAARGHHHGRGNQGPPVRAGYFGAGAFAYGTVGTGDTSGFAVTTPTGASVTVGTSAGTKFKAVNSKDGATFQAGDAVLASGAFVNGFTARVVWYDSATFPLGQPQLYAGVGVSNTATQLVVTVSGAADTFVLNANTKFWVNGASTAAASVPDVSGDAIRVAATPMTDGTSVALRVLVHLPKS